MTRIDRVVQVAAKPDSRSKTLWVNGLTALGLVVAIVADAMDAAAALGLDLPDDLGKYVALALAVANIILRRVTVAPLHSAVKSGRV